MDYSFAPRGATLPRISCQNISRPVWHYARLIREKSRIETEDDDIMLNKLPLLSSTRPGSSHKATSAIKNRPVSAGEFLRLMLSTRKLLRDDPRDGGLRAVVDPETGDRFVVEEDKLANLTTAGRPRHAARTAAATG